MNKFEKNLNRLGIIIGITMVVVVIMAMSSCGTTKMYDIGTGNELSRSKCTGNYIYK